MRTTHPLEFEICSILGMEPLDPNVQDRDIRQNHLREIMEKIQSLSQDEIESLSEEVINWYNFNVNLINQDKPLVDFWFLEDGFEEPETEEAETDPVKVAEVIEQTLKNVKKPTGRPKKKPGAKSAVKEARKIIVDYYSQGKYISSPQLQQELNRRGLTLSKTSINFIIYEVKQTLRVLIEKGLLNLSEPKRKKI